MSEETIQIPIKEYELFRNSILLHDKSPMIKDLLQILQECKQDAERYKEKFEQTERILQRTKKQLDKCMQYEKPGNNSNTSKFVSIRPGYVKVKTVSDETPKGTQLLSHSSEQVVCRAIDDNRPVEHDETSPSLPLTNSRMSIVGDNNTSLKSLPVNLTGFTAPGMSAALLKKLVAENLRLRKLLEGKTGNRIMKYPEDAENVISELKLKLNKQEQMISDLRGKTTPHNDEDALNVQSELAVLRKKNEDYEKTIEMDKIVIESLTSQIKDKERANKDMQNLLVQYQQFQAATEESNSKISSLQKDLEELKACKKALSEKLSNSVEEIQKLKQQLIKAEQDRDLHYQNYLAVCSQMQRPSPSTYQSSQLSATSPVTGYGSQPVLTNSYMETANQPNTTTHIMAQSPQPVLPPRPNPDSGFVSRLPQDREPPLPPRMSHYTHPTSSAATSPPQPRERKTYKCPRCETIFDLLQTYRDHIKVCLKTC